MIGGSGVRIARIRWGGETRTGEEPSEEPGDEPSDEPSEEKERR
jgi:hypothetical protein